MEEADEDIQTEGGGSVTQEHRKYLKEFCRCELCGSPKALELHHIIPTAFGGPDVMENWIAICHGCHAKLTPKRLLINRGIAKHYDPIHDFYKAMNDALEDAINGDGIDCYGFDANFVLDTFDAIFRDPQNPVKAEYTCSRYKEQST